MDKVAGERVLRRSWVLLAAPMAVLLAADSLAVVILFATAHWVAAAQASAGAVVAYWFAVGAWLRTPWSVIHSRVAPPGAPELTSMRSRHYIALALVCVIACVVALGMQAIDGGWTY